MRHMLERTGVLILSVVLCFSAATVVLGNTESSKEFQGKKLLFIDSYHEGYEWSDGIVSGMRSVLQGSGVELKIHRMDTKRNSAEDFKIAAAWQAKQAIESFKPDVIIASDDNASKYLVMPHYKDAELPFVFCGVNWDAGKYGYPYKNATGMVELDPMEEMLKFFNRFAKGGRIGYVSGDTYTDRIIAENVNKRFLSGEMKIDMAKTFAEYTGILLRAQEENDALILNNNVGIPDWDQKKALSFIENHLKIPTSTTNPWMADLTLFAMAKLPEEQGAWAAKTAMQILSGAKPSAIPLSYNRMAVLTVNMRVAKRIGVLFDLSDLQRARIIR